MADLNQTIILKYSDVAGNVPTLQNLVRGELAVNVADGKLFIRKAGETEGTDTIVSMKVQDSSLANLTDVVLNSVADKQFLAYNAEDSTWKNISLTTDYLSDFESAVKTIIGAELGGSTDFVNVTDDQTIDGTKTFNTAPLIGTETVTTVEKVDKAINDKLVEETGKTIQPYDENLDKLSKLTGNGLVVKTEEGFVNRAFESNTLSITNADGTGGNPKLELKESGVTAGEYTKVTVNAQGLVTDAENPTTLEGYGITNAVKKTGDTLTGKLTYSGIAVADLTANDLVTKQYVDDIAEGHVSHQACDLAFLEPLEGTYATGSNAQYPGVGATFTLTNPIEGVEEGNRVLLAGQENMTQNGVYTVTSPTVLTRAEDLDGNPTQEVFAGASFFILNGEHKGATFSLTNKTIDFGTENIEFVQTNEQSEYTAGAGIKIINGTQISVEQGTTVQVINGKLEVASGTGNKDKVLVAGEDGTAAVYKELSLNTIDGVLGVAKGGTGASTIDTNKLILGNGTDPIKVVENEDGVLIGTAAEAPSFGKANLTKHVEGILPVANGGTGASTKAGAFDSLAPTTSKGDLIVNNGTSNIALSVGANGTLLVADSESETGFTWTNVIRGGTF